MFEILGKYKHTEINELLGLKDDGNCIVCRFDMNFKFRHDLE